MLGVSAAGIAWISADSATDDEAKERRLANLKPFKPGQSGNPGGRSKAQIDVRNAARAYTAEAVETLAHVMRNGRHGERVIAANALLDRGWGRPQQSADVNMKRDIYDYSNAELAAIIAGCRGEIDGGPPHLGDHLRYWVSN